MRAKAVSEQRLTFAAPALAGHSWCAYEIDGTAPGPRLCVMAGMHVNEVAGIAAALQLIDYFSETAFSGQVAILPVTDPAAIATRAARIDRLTPELLKSAYERYFPVSRYTHATLLPAEDAGSASKPTPTEGASAPPKP